MFQTLRVTTDIAQLVAGDDQAMVEPAKLADRVIAPGDGEAEPGDGTHEDAAHEVGDRFYEAGEEVDSHY